MPPRPTNNSQLPPANSASKFTPQTPEVAIQTNSSVKPCVPCGEFSRLDEIKARAARVKSNIRKILLTSPAFPRLYADVVLHYAPNSHEARILRPHYQKICEKVNAMSNSNGTCTHIKVTGARCGSPALKGEQFCYFHQNAIRSVRRPKQSRLHPIALIEDEESIQYAVMEVINALMKNTIDLKRATLILRALHIAVKNASRVKFEVQGMNSVRQIPEYAPPLDNTDPSETAEIDLPYNAWVPQKSERQIMEENHSARKLQEWKDQQAAIRANLERARITPRKEESTHGPKQSTPNVADATTTHMGTASVGTDAFVRPASEASVPAAEASTSPQAAPHATAVPPHNFKPQQTSPEPPMTANQSPGTKRKPPQPATAAPNGRKNAAHACPQQNRRAAKHA